MEPHISIYLTDIKSFFNLDNLEPAQRRPALLFLVLLPPILKLDILEQAPGCPNYTNYFISVKYILIWGFTQKISSLPRKMTSQIPKNAKLHEIPPPLELNWRFQAPKLRGFFRHKILSEKRIQIFINVPLLFFKRKKF